MVNFIKVFERAKKNFNVDVLFSDTTNFEELGLYNVILELQRVTSEEIKKISEIKKLKLSDDKIDYITSACIIKYANTDNQILPDKLVFSDWVTETQWGPIYGDDIENMTKIFLRELDDIEFTEELIQIIINSEDLDISLSEHDMTIGSIDLYIVMDYYIYDEPKHIDFFDRVDDIKIKKLLNYIKKI